MSYVIERHEASRVEKLPGLHASLAAVRKYLVERFPNHYIATFDKDGFVILYPRTSNRFDYHIRLIVKETEK